MRDDRHRGGKGGGYSMATGRIFRFSRSESVEIQDIQNLN